MGVPLSSSAAAVSSGARSPTSRALDHHARCIVVERDGIATNASGAAARELSPAGLSQLNPAFAGNDPSVDLSVEGLRLH